MLVLVKKVQKSNWLPDRIIEFISIETGAICLVMWIKNVACASTPGVSLLAGTTRTALPGLVDYSSSLCFVSIVVGTFLG